MRSIGLSALAGLLAVALFTVAIACGGAEETEAEPAAPAIDTAALSEAVAAAVKQAVPAAVQQAVPQQVSAQEIQRMVEIAIAAAAPETATPAEIQRMVEDAVTASAQPGATKEEIEGLVTAAVSQSVAQIQPGVSAGEVQKLVSDALKAVPTPVTQVIERVVIATPVPAPVTSDPIYGGTLRVTSASSIGTLDLTYINSGVGAAISSHLYETLFGLNEELNPTPMMLRSWSVEPDGLGYTFTLRSGLKFHNGDDFTADDAVASFKRVIVPDGDSHPKLKILVPYLPEEDWITKVSDDTFKLTLTDPYCCVVDLLARFGGGVMMHTEEDAATPYTEPVDTNIGTGPYQFQEWRQGHKLVLSRFGDYKPRSEPGSYMAGAKSAYLDKIEWLEIPDEETKLAGLETGEWDVVDNAGLDFYQRVVDNSDLDVMIGLPGFQSSLIYMTKPNPDTGMENPMANKLMRQAVAVAINAEDMMGSLGPPALWELCGAVFYCGTPLESTAGTDRYNVQDLELAKRLMEQAGYGGEELVILSPTDYPQLTPLGPVLKPALEKAGFNVSMPTLDWAGVLARLTTPDWHIMVNYCGLSACGGVLSNFWLTPGNFLGAWPNLNELAKAYALAGTQEEQLGIVDQIGDLFYDEQPYTILGQWFPITPFQKYVKNLRPGPMPIYSNVWIDR